MKEWCEKIVCIGGNAFCESCTSDGIMTEQHISINDDGTSWCLMCAWTMGLITKDERREFGLENLKIRERYLIESLIKVQTAIGDS